MAQKSKNIRYYCIAICIILCYTFFNAFYMPQSASAQTPVQTNGLENGGIYKLQNVYTGLYLDVAQAATENGTQLLQWRYRDTNNQKFVLKLNNGKWKIYPLHTQSLDKVLDIPWASPDDNITVALYDEFDSEAQGFHFNYLYDNIYTITTQPSNYVKYLGIQNNSSNLSAYVVQTSDVTSAKWRLIKVGPDVSGITINNGEKYPAPSNHYVLGDCTYVGDAVIQGERIKKQDETEIFDKYYVRFYRYENRLSAKLQEYDSVMIQPGQSASYTCGKIYTYIETNEETIKLGFERALSFGETVGFNGGNLNLELKCAQEVKANIETTYKYSITQQLTINQNTEITSGVNNSGVPITYIFESRAIYSCYVAQIYEIGYQETIVKEGWWIFGTDVHYYTATGINTGVGEQQFLEVLSLSICLTPYKYDSASGKMVYDGAREPDVIYV